MSDDDLRRRLRAWLDAHAVDPRFADRAIGEAVSAQRHRRALSRRAASVAVGTAVGVALAGVLALALTSRGHSRPPTALHHTVIASPGSPSASPSLPPATPTAPLVVGTAPPTARPTGTPHATPTPIPVPSLGARSDPAMSYDPSTNTVLLYGGQRSTSTSGGSVTTYLEDTWRWDGAHWTALNATAGQLYSEAMAYDMATNQMVMVGATTDGNGVVKQGGDAATYIWTGKGWQQARPANPPVNFFSASTVYDTQSRRLMLLTSGVVATGSYTAAHRLYSWDGGQWTLLWTSPPRTITTYEPDVLVELPNALGYAGLGQDSHSTSGNRPGALYTFDGSVWVENDVPGTPGAVGAALLDVGHQRVVVVGGSLTPTPDTGPGVDSTFLYDGTTWTSSPLQHALVNRIAEGIAFDKAGGDVIITGGEIGQGFVSTPPPPPPTDTWGWNGSTWAIRAQ